MGYFYDTVVKMRENGRTLVKSEAPVKVAPKATVSKKETVAEKPKETAVKKNDKGTNKKS